MDRTLGDRDDVARVGRVVAERELTIVGFTEDEAGLVAEVARRVAGPRRATHRLDTRRPRAQRRVEKRREPLLLAPELFRVRKVLPIASSAGPEVPAER